MDCVGSTRAIGQYLAPAHAAGKRDVIDRGWEAGLSSLVDMHGKAPCAYFDSFICHAPPSA
jgi:hypothetical protein